MRKHILSLLVPIPLCLACIQVSGCTASPGDKNSADDSPAKAQLTLESGEAAQVRQTITIKGEPKIYKEQSLFTTPWGNEEGALGKEDVGGRPGPMSFTMDPFGNIVVADSINGRIVRYDEQGRVRSILKTGETLPEFVSVDTQNHTRVLLYDSLETAYRVIHFDENGDEIENLDVFVPQPTEVFSHGEDTLVESRHSWVYKPDSSGNERNKWKPFVIGRPDQRDPDVFWSAAKNNSGNGILLQASNRKRVLIQSISLALQGRLLSLFSLDTDSEGNIYVGFYIDDRAELAVISPEDGLIGHLPITPIRYSSSKRFISVGRDGRVVEMRTSPEGVHFVQLDWRR